MDFRSLHKRDKARVLTHRHKQKRKPIILMIIIVIKIVINEHKVIK